MLVHSPTSRSGSRIYLSIWDLFWALVTPILALYLRNVDIQSTADWSVIASYWVLSAGFAILAFFAFRLQDGMTLPTKRPRRRRPSPTSPASTTLLAYPWIGFDEQSPSTPTMRCAICTAIRAG